MAGGYAEFFGKCVQNFPDVYDYLGRWTECIVQPILSQNFIKSRNEQYRMK